MTVRLPRCGSFSIYRATSGATHSQSRRGARSGAPAQTGTGPRVVKLERDSKIFQAASLAPVARGAADTVLSVELPIAELPAAAARAERTRVASAPRSSWSWGANRDHRLSAPWVVFWIALAVRLLYLTLAHTYRIGAYDGQFHFGWEMGRIARSLAAGHGYANPFHGDTGPTAWVAPLYPLLLAGVFKLFGVYSPQSAWVALSLNCVFSALTARVVWEIGARCFSRPVAQWSSWIWALYPAAMQYDVRWVWETSLSTLLFGCSIVLALRMRGVGSEDEAPSAATARRRWAAFGLTWGALGLTNPALLLFLPASFAWVLDWRLDWHLAWRPGAHRAARRREWRPQAGNVLLSVALIAATLAPWGLRNLIVFHRLIPLRANFGAELYLGNGPGASGLLMEYDHPMQAPQQLRLYSAMGEVTYSALRGREAWAVIRKSPSHFAADCLKRFFFFWGGVPHPEDDGALVEWGRSLNFVWTSVCGLLGLAWALRMRMPGAWLFFWAFLLTPLLYYFVTVHARFRHPLEPLITVLGVAVFHASGHSSGQGVRQAVSRDEVVAAS